MQMVKECKICKSKNSVGLKAYRVSTTHHPELENILETEEVIKIVLRMCAQCGFVYHDRILSLDELKTLYLQEDRITYKKQNHQKKILLNRALRFIESRFDFKGMKNVIDVGSGDFSLLEILMERHPEKSFDAVNVSYESDHRGKIRVFRTMLEDLEEGGNRYQLIILSHILEHVADFELFFAGLRKIITDETELYVEVPYQVGPGILLNRGFHLQHINYFTPKTLERLLASYGYGLNSLEFDTEGGYFHYGIPGIIRAKFSRKTPASIMNARNMRSILFTLFSLVNPRIIISGWIKRRLLVVNADSL
jgi:hypothetical protein